MTEIPTLRPYQVDVLAHVLRSVRERAGRTFVVEISRQGGKNETSARLEALLLKAHQVRGGTIVKTAPTLKPQLQTSFMRLSDYLDRDRIAHTSAFPDITVGAARVRYLSAAPTANVVGATADLLLEVDEAQDVDPDIYNVRFRPMASTGNATTVLYGTPWADNDLLETTLQQCAADERRDGIRRVFRFDWRTVAAYNDAYATYVANERKRLGPDHPLFTTQYDLTPIAGAGHLLSPGQLANIFAGTHVRITAPILGERYVAGLDLAGEDTGSDRLTDRTVLTIARATEPNAGHRTAGIQPIDIVHHITMRGELHAHQLATLIRVLQQWRPYAIAIDATGIGQATASNIRSACPWLAVTPYAMSDKSKSELGFHLISAASASAVTLYAPDGSADYTTAADELRRCRREVRPNNLIRWSVPESEGNDDYVVSTALVAWVAHLHPQRIARARQ